MRRAVLWLAALAAVMLIPSRGTDVGKLRPVGLLLVDRQDERIVITADTGDTGEGTSVQEAIEDLRESALGMIYLDTAEKLLIYEDAEDTLTAFEAILRPGTELCKAAGLADAAEAYQFLSAHPTEITFLNIGEIIPMIRKENAKYRYE